MAELAKKLGIKPGHKVLLMNAPDGYLQTLGTLPDGAEVKTNADGTYDTYDVVQLFVKSKADVDNHTPQAIKAIKPGGMLWLTYPKKSSKIKTDISRDEGWEGIRNAGWEGVSLVAVDDVWAAMRFRPIQDVKSRK